MPANFAEKLWLFSTAQDWFNVGVKDAHFGMFRCFSAKQRLLLPLLIQTDILVSITLSRYTNELTSLISFLSIVTEVLAVFSIWWIPAFFYFFFLTFIWQQKKNITEDCELIHIFSINFFLHLLYRMIMKVMCLKFRQSYTTSPKSNTNCNKFKNAKFFWGFFWGGHEKNETNLGQNVMPD